LVKAEDRFQTEPTLVQGSLSNGLEYAILPNKLPENRAFLRLIVNAGSILEEEDQLGLAHLLEHMAFNGTRSYPENELVEYLQSLGMEFGPEINAYTSFDETVYKLSVPTDSLDGLKEGLNVLEEWAFHMNLTDEDINAERPVIIEEWRSGRSASSRMQEAAFPDIYKDSLYGVRLPIGTVESIETFDTDRIRDFYNDWYRPDLMSIVVVGDVDPAEAEALIKEHFSSYRNDPDAPRRRQPEIPDHSEDIYTLQRDEETSYTSLEIIKKTPAYDLKNGADYRRYLKEQLFLSLFNNRMTTFLREGEPDFIDGYASSNTQMRPIDQLSLGVIAGPEKLREGIYSFWREVLRIKRHGFSEMEWEQAKKELKSSYDYLYGQRNSLYSSDLVEMLSFSLIHDEPYPSIVWECETVWRLLDEISLKEVLDWGNQWFEPGNRVYFSMERSQEEPLTEEELKMLMARVEAETILPRQAERDLGELVPNPPEAGIIVEQALPGEWEAPESLGITRLKYQNGAVVYLKPTDFRENEMVFQAISEGGASLVDQEDMISASLSTLAISQSGLGDYSISELERLLADRYISISPSLNNYSESISGFSSPADMEILLQLTYLYFTSPIYEANRWKSYENRLLAYLESMESNPNEQYRRMINRILYENHPRMAPLTAENLDQMDYETAYRIFKQRFLTGGDFDFIFVGKFDPQELTPIISQWIGSLPPQGEEREKWMDRDVRYTTENHFEELKKNADPLSISTLTFTGTMDWSYWESLKLQALASVMEDRLLEVIREKEGGTYSISSNVQIHNIPIGEYALYLQFTCDPERREALTQEIYDEIDKLFSGDTLESYARNYREAQLSSLDENQQSNRWWLQELSFLAGQDRETAVQWLKQEDLIKQIDAEVLREAAMEYLEDAALQELILSPRE